MHERILVIDDEAAFTHVLKRSLEMWGGYQVREENSSANAVGAARAFRPDLILLDLMMPELNGAEVAREIRADADLCATPVLFLTAAALEAGVPHGYEFGQAYTFLKKPVDLDRLLKSVRSEIDRHAAP